ncbi:S41 family peptidase [Singulisphaera sp. PoT]|uniref:S41 family peptidase n=1 Tax=Singulisphaera sp. PoT TaxID=3411797 RepID=UPI003BF5C7F9
MLQRISQGLRPLALLAAAWGVMTAPAWGLDKKDTRFLHDPAIGKERLVFVYADDLWTAKHDGSDVRRLTSHPGSESGPYISPDGKLVAFTAVYDGNVDAFVVPIEGGEPKRLTWHPGADAVRGFAPDGSVLFASQRSVFTQRWAQFFTIGTSGGAASRLPVPSGDRVVYSPDGKFLAYTPLPEAFRQWKNYRGGRNSRIWILKLEGLGVEQIPQPDGFCNDTYPMWAGDKVYFLSDRNGEFNLFSYDRASKEVKALTEHDDFPIEAASAGAGKVVYEQAGRIHTFDIETGKVERLKIGVAGDVVETRPRFAEGGKSIRSADISPSGKRAVFEARGEVVTVPAKHGDVHNLTQSVDVHERSPVWSPDGKSIAYFSDASGEYALHVRPQDGKGEAKAFALKGAGFYERPVWSPDSKKIAYIDNSRTLYVIDVGSGEVKKVGSEPIYGPVNTMAFHWSPDSKWLAYTLINKVYFQSLYLYDVARNESHKMTSGLADTSEPAFDAGGKYLYFFASTDAGPMRQWFDQSNNDNQATQAVYVAVLSKSTPNPLSKETDEEGDDAKDKDKDKDKEKKDDAKKDEEKKDDKDKEKSKDKEDSKSEKKAADTPIDIEGFEGRVLSLPIPAGNLYGLTAGAEGTLYYVRRVGMIPGRSGDAFAGTPSLVKFDLKERKEETLAEQVDGFRVSADHKRLLYHATSGAWGIVDAGKFSAGSGKLATDSISIRIEPRAEWKQILHEAWRINRDYFYATNMHGADWSAILAKYEPIVDEVPTRADLNRLIRMMLSELAVGHSYLGGGERLYEPKTVPVGLLGADYEVADGRYRFAAIYGGMNWDAQLRAPLVAPGVDVKVGEFLLAVDGEEVRTDSEVYRPFENKVGRRVELKVGPTADGKGSRTIVVEPVGDESSLRHLDWLEKNLRKVRDRTEGRVAYVYVPNTAEAGHAYFKKYFFPQADKDAIIVDERFNGGGSVADYYIDILRRPVVSYWAMRHGETIRTPGAAVLGPKVMIIDETAGSGGDLLPWMFRKFKLGTLVGRRTWGGLVGILGFPELMDGGNVTAPDLAFYNEDGWRVENEGVAPDVEVEQWPADIADGKDPQLDKAIDIALEKLKADPPKPLPRPDFPVRVRKGKAPVAN